MIRIHQSLFSPHPGADPSGRAAPADRASQAQEQARGAKFLNLSSLILQLGIIIKPNLLRIRLGLKPLFDWAFREAVKNQLVNPVSSC